jgi:hemophore-related protein
MASSALIRAVIILTGLITAASPLPTASADPADGPLIQTTCSYPQLMAAMQVEAPNASARLAERPQAQAKLQEFVALPIDQRKQRVQRFLDRNPDVRAMIEQKRNTPEGQAKLQTAAEIAATCHNY